MGEKITPVPNSDEMFGMKDTISSKAPSMKFSKEDKKGQKKQDKEKNFPVEVKKEIIVDDSWMFLSNPHILLCTS